MHLDGDGKWRPYATWTGGEVQEGEWIFHECEITISRIPLSGN